MAGHCPFYDGLGPEAAPLVVTLALQAKRMPHGAICVTPGLACRRGSPTFCVPLRTLLVVAPQRVCEQNNLLNVAVHGIDMNDSHDGIHITRQHNVLVARLV